MKNQENFVEALCTILIAQNVISKDEASAMKKIFKDRSLPAFDDFLLQEGLVDRIDLLNALSIYFKVPAFDVVGYFFEHLLVTQFPKEVMTSNVFIPAFVEENTILIVVTDNPADENLLVVIGAYVSYDVQFMVGLTQDIIDAVQEFYDDSLTLIEDDEESLDHEHDQEKDEQDIEHGLDDE